MLLSSFGLASAQKIDPLDLARLKALNADFIHNFVTSDTVAHNKIIHKDFIEITSAGKYVSRKDYMEDWAHGFAGLVYWDYRGEDIKIFGNTALVHARCKFISIKEGKEVVGINTYTDVYIKENGDWKCIQAQITKVAPENFPGDETIIKKYDFRK